MTNNRLIEYYSELINNIRILAVKSSPLLIAIEGNCGSGKTTLSSILKERFSCNVFSTDDFFLPITMKTEDRLSEPGGNVDYQRLNETFSAIDNKSSIKYSRFDCKTQSYEDEIEIPITNIIIIEGVYSMHPKLDINYDIKIFLETSYDTQIERIEKRNGPHMLKRFKEEWMPLENKYFEYYQIKSKCDYIYNTTMSQF